MEVQVKCSFCGIDSGEKTEDGYLKYDEEGWVFINIPANGSTGIIFGGEILNLKGPRELNFCSHGCLCSFYEKHFTNFYNNPKYYIKS
jgi:hypothetical protein